VSNAELKKVLSLAIFLGNNLERVNKGKSFKDFVPTGVIT